MSYFIEVRKKLKKVILPVVLAFVILSSPVLATYSADVQLTELSGNTYAMYPALTYLNVSNLVSTGIIDADGLDTLVTTATSSFPHMLSNNKLLFALPLGPYNTIPLSFTTGNTPLSAFRIIIGYSGNITVLDSGILEPSDNFTIIMASWWDTTLGANKDAVYKEDAFRLFVSDTVSGNITATVFGSANVTALGVSSGEHTVRVTIEVR